MAVISKIRFKEKFGMTTMLLHASELTFAWEGATIEIYANLQAEFKRMLDTLKLPIDLIDPVKFKKL